MAFRRALQQFEDDAIGGERPPLPRQLLVTDSSKLAEAIKIHVKKLMEGSKFEITISPSAEGVQGPSPDVLVEVKEAEYPVICTLHKLLEMIDAYGGVGFLSEYKIRQSNVLPVQVEVSDHEDIDDGIEVKKKSLIKTTWTTLITLLVVNASKKLHSRR